MGPWALAHVLTWDSICLNFFHSASGSPKSMTFSQKTALSWEYYQDGLSTATFHGAPEFPRTITGVFVMPNGGTSCCLFLSLTFCLFLFLPTLED